MTSEGVAKQVDVAIAEFNALRTEIVGRRGNQKNVVALALTAYGVLFTIAFGKDGDLRLLLLVPVGPVEPRASVFPTGQPRDPLVNVGVDGARTCPTSCLVGSRRPNPATRG